MCISNQNQLLVKRIGKSKFVTSFFIVNFCGSNILIAQGILTLAVIPNFSILHNVKICLFIIAFKQKKVHKLDCYVSLFYIFKAFRI